MQTFEDKRRKSLDRVYAELRKTWPSAHEMVVQHATALNLNDEYDLHQIAEIEASMMSLALGLLKREVF